MPRCASGMLVSKKSKGRRMAIDIKNYERNQDFSVLTRWLHSYRFRHTLDVLDGFSRAHSGPINLLEIGCAQAKLFGLLNPIFPLDYTGIEINSNFVAAARAKHAGLDNFRVIEQDALSALDGMKSPDIVIALETLEHIPAPVTFRIVEKVAQLRPKLFVCSVPVEIGPSLALKNIGSALTGYVRHRSYGWRQTFWASTYQLHRLPPHSTAHNGFDWRWLAHTIRCHFQIREIRRFPLGFLPTAVSSSVFMIAEPRATS